MDYSTARHFGGMESYATSVGEKRKLEALERLRAGTIRSQGSLDMESWHELARAGAGGVVALATGLLPALGGTGVRGEEPGHLGQRGLVEMIAQGLTKEAFERAFKHGDERFETSFTGADVSALEVYVSAQPRPVTNVELARHGLIEPLPGEERAAIRHGEGAVCQHRVRRVSSADAGRS